MGPVHAARAEAAFLSGNASGSRAEARKVYDLAAERGHFGNAGELAYWRWKGGELAQPPPNIAKPFALHIAGDWAAAAAAWDELGQPYEAARARGDGTEEAALRSALAAFERLGARPAAALVRRRLRTLGVSGVPRGPRPATRSSPAGLTRRETEILELLATGHGNRAIAGRLFLSPRTVENHVSAILAKLGVATRAEATVAAARLGIISQSDTESG